MALPLLGLLLSGVPGPGLNGPAWGGAHEAAAQEFRVTGGTASAPDSNIIGGRGWGVGVRHFFWDGFGLGIESDRFSEDASLLLETCSPAGGDCRMEPVRFSTDLDTTTLLFLLRLPVRDDVEFRVGGGRVAGTANTAGVGEETGRIVEILPADRDAGPLAWSRGADGNVIVFEALYRLPVPGPFPVSGFAMFRRHDLTMRGCGEERSLLCGSLNHRELQLGLHLHLFPRVGREG